MANATYGQFCPVAMATEILCTRRTIILVRELVASSTRFDDLRRDVPCMSPAPLSKRLKELEAAGIVHRAPVAREAGVFDYRLTRAGQELAPVVEAFGYGASAGSTAIRRSSSSTCNCSCGTCDAASCSIRCPTANRSCSPLSGPAGRSPFRVAGRETRRGNRTLLRRPRFRR
ncbi:MAG: helix-turn-helix transcriptional regulator [Sphingopyxis sp.]|nr:helix-turn-helix transcriptional regulator [Sphingopyxis sp.]